MHRITLSNTIAPVPIAIGAVLLLLISSGVITIWHNPLSFPSLYPYATLMTYNTAASFLLCGMVLIALLNQLRRTGVVLSLGLLILSGIRISEMLLDLPFDADYWYKTLLPSPITVAIPTSSITSITFVFTAVSLLLLFSQLLTPTKILVTAFIALLIATIASAIWSDTACIYFPAPSGRGAKCRHIPPSVFLPMLQQLLPAYTLIYWLLLHV